MPTMEATQAEIAGDPPTSGVPMFGLRIIRHGAAGLLENDEVHGRLSLPELRALIDSTLPTIGPLDHVEFRVWRGIA